MLDNVSVLRSGVGVSIDIGRCGRLRSLHSNNFLHMIGLRGDDDPSRLATGVASRIPLGYSSARDALTI